MEFTTPTGDIDFDEALSDNFAMAVGCIKGMRDTFITVATNVMWMDSLFRCYIDEEDGQVMTREITGKNAKQPSGCNNMVLVTCNKRHVKHNVSSRSSSWTCVCAVI